MLQTSRALLLTVAIVVALSGCSGVMGNGGNGDSATSQQIQCVNGEIPADTELTRLMPAESGEWEKLEKETIEVKSNKGVVEVPVSELWKPEDVDPESFESRRFKHSESGNYTIQITRWPSEEEAGNFSNAFGTVAASSGNIQTSVYGNTSEYGKNLLKLVPCIGEQDVQETDLFTINGSFSIGTASISNVDYELVSGAFSGYELLLDIEGEVEDISLTVEVTDSDGNQVGTSYLSGEDFTEGSTEVSVPLDGGVGGEDFTLNIDDGRSNESVYEQTVSISEPELTIDSVDTEVDEYEYSETKSLNRVEVDVTNNGEIPVAVDDLVVEIDGESVSAFVQENLQPGGSATLDGVIMEGMDKSVSSVDIVVHGDGKELGRTTTRV